MAALARPRKYEHVFIWDLKKGYPFSSVKTSPHVIGQQNLYLNGIAFQLNSSNHKDEVSHYLRKVNWTSSDGTERSRMEFNLNLPPGATHEIERGLRVQEQYFLDQASKEALRMQLFSCDVDPRQCFKSSVDTYLKDKDLEAGKVPTYGPTIKVQVPATCRVEILDDTKGSRYSYEETTLSEVNRYKTAIVIFSMMFGCRTGGDKGSTCFSRLTALRITLVKSTRKPERISLAGAKRKREQMELPEPVL